MSRPTLGRAWVLLGFLAVTAALVWIVRSLVHDIRAGSA